MVWSEETQTTQSWNSQGVNWEAVSNNWDSLISSDNWVEESNATE